MIAGGITALHNGMPVAVTFNGVMTRSLPGQITADAVVVPTLTGTIKAVEKDRVVLAQDDEMGDVIVHINEETTLPADYALAAGNRIQVVTNGIMALSSPPQVNALFLFPLAGGE